jgi:drug/metabolite transporter (DMT)-like permease
MPREANARAETKKRNALHRLSAVLAGALPASERAPGRRARQRTVVRFSKEEERESAPPLVAFAATPSRALVGGPEFSDSVPSRGWNGVEDISIQAAILLAVVAAVGFNVAAAFQKAAAVRLPRLSFPPERRAIRAFLTNGPWMRAFLLAVASEGCFLVAAANAPISLLQPILGTGLVVLAGFSVFYLEEELSTGEWIGIFTLIAGLAMLGASAESGEVRDLEAVSWTRLIGLTLSLSALVFAVKTIRDRRGEGLSIELAVGAASGVMIGIGALFTRVTLLELKAGNLLLGAPLILVTLTSLLSGVFTQQGGFQRGRAMTVTALLAVLNKVIAIFGGMFALGEVLPEDPVKQSLRVAALVALLAGTALLARLGKSENTLSGVDADIEIG